MTSYHRALKINRSESVETTLRTRRLLGKGAHPNERRAVANWISAPHLHDLRKTPDLIILQNQIRCHKVWLKRSVFYCFFVILLLLRLEYLTGGYNPGASSQAQTKKHDNTPGTTTRSVQRRTYVASVKIVILLPGTECRK